MVYTANVPQANQAIATTQPTILANFNFLASSIGQEHNFNGAGSGTDTYHLQASMPNKSVDPTSLPAGTNGVYYVLGNTAKFYNTSQVGGNLLGAVNAMINFNGTGATGQSLNAGGNQIRNSFNINASLSTHDSTGNYTITFTNPLPSINGCVLITGMRGATGEVFGFIQGATSLSTSYSTTQIKIGFQSSSSTARDVLVGTLMIFGG
jgi:hypothetical protein